MARTCATKLFYRKRGYPFVEDEYDKFERFSHSGLIIQTIARSLYPEGEELGLDLEIEETAQRAMRILSHDEATLIGASLISAGKYARIDILRKRGNDFELIDAKARAYDSHENARAMERNGRNLFWSKRQPSIATHWRADLEDVTFQVVVLRELYPNARIWPFLLMPDKAKVASFNSIYSQFEIRHEMLPHSGRQQISANFKGDPSALHNDHFLTLVSVQKEVEELVSSVRQAAAEYVESLQRPLQKIKVSLSVGCRECEFQSTAPSFASGFQECWQGLARVSPNILDLYHVSDAGGRDRSLSDALIRRGRVSLFDMPKKYLTRVNGSVGSINKRQLVQIKNTQNGTEWVSNELAEILGRLKFPLHFIDFETTTPAVPYFPDTHPFDTVAFQWSCHTLRSPYLLPEHSEWLSSSDTFPNFEFAKSLMRQLGTNGTILTWSSHELAILKSILRQMKERSHQDDALKNWLSDLNQAKEENSDRLVDMNQLCLNHYFHPFMKGSTSVKKVCEAIWQTSPFLNTESPEYYVKIDGRILSPYEALPHLEINGNHVAVTEGIGAIRAYHTMLFSLEGDDPGTRTRWRQLLLQYCKLDTLAMVWIWRHWTDRAGPEAKSATRQNFG